jgi:hypothetical protein
MANEEGHYRLPFEEPPEDKSQKHWLLVKAKGYATQAIEVESDNLKSDFSLDKGRQFDVEVLGPDGKPVRGAEVRITIAQYGFFAALGRTNAKGQCHFDHAPRAAFTVSMRLREKRNYAASKVTKDMTNAVLKFKAR